jgi:hypothetical protein
LFKPGAEGNEQIIFNREHGLILRSPAFSAVSSNLRHTALCDGIQNGIQTVPFISHNTLGASMKKIISLMAVAFAFSFGMAAQAADGDAKTAQQSKMKTCNVDAKDKKGDERKAFMKECLSKKPA